MASIPHSPEDQQFLDDIPSHHILAFRNYANPALFLDNNWICITRLRYFLLDVMPEASTTSQQPPKRVEASSSSASSAPNIKVERVDHSLPKIKREPVTSDLPLAPSIVKTRVLSSERWDKTVSPPNKTGRNLSTCSTDTCSIKRHCFIWKIPMANPFLEAQDHKYAGFGTGLNDFGFDFTSQVTSGSSVAFDFESFDYDALLGDDMDSFIPRSSPTPSGWPTLPAAPPSTPPRASPAVLMDIAANAGEVSPRMPPRIKLHALESNLTFDVLTIGGGVAGAGWRARGSLWMAHSPNPPNSFMGACGICRVMEADWEQWKLVRETLFERATFLHIVPYLNMMLPIMLPVYKRNTTNFHTTYFAGYKLYDVLTGKEGMGGSWVCGRATALASFPNVKEGLVGGVVYQDKYFFLVGRRDLIREDKGERCLVVRAMGIRLSEGNANFLSSFQLPFVLPTSGEIRRALSLAAGLLGSLRVVTFAVAFQLFGVYAKFLGLALPCSLLSCHFFLFVSVPQLRIRR
ncbi:hypothetical protein C8J56DRAFT_1103773 [Mycena floridula]|nr:hypothetical protein C8J56DRAFT_1103773 [Mycena floridula]